MSEVLKIEIGAISIVHIIAIIIAIGFFMMFYMKANKDAALKAFLILQISIIGWMVFKIFKTVSPTESTRWWFIVGYYFCACIFEVAFLEFTYSYYKGRGLKKKVRMVIYILPVMQFIWVVTNPYHYLFYSVYNFRGDSFGKLFYYHTAIVYSFIAVGFYYGYKTFRKRYRGEKRWLKGVIALAIILPLILNFLFITKKIHRFVFAIGIPVIFDITPIVFVITVLVFVYATLNHDLINISPIMKHEIVHKLDTPIGVFDSSLECIYINEKLNNILNEDDVFQLKNVIGLWHHSGFKDEQSEIKIGDHILNVFIQEVWSIKETQYLMIINEITDYKLVEEKIQSKQDGLNIANEALEETIQTLKQTSKIGARNYVARELHDIIGHSLVVTIKLLEVSRLYFHKDKTLSLNALLDSGKSLDSGIENMNAVASELNSFTGSDLEKEIKNILDPIKRTGVEAQLSFKGAYFTIEEKTFGVLKRVVLELVTNTLKHSKSKGLFVSVNIKQDRIMTMVLDNGVGCKKVSPGNGLKGIQKRLDIVNGTIEFITAPDEGFMSKINIAKP